MVFNITIGGYEPEGVIDVSTGSEVGDLGRATLEVAKTPNNRENIASGDEVIIERTNSTWTGVVTGKPTNESDGVLVVDALDGRYSLNTSTVARPFFETDSGAAIREAIESRSESRGRESVHVGSSLDGWTSDFHVFELGQLATKQLHERGSDILFGGLREGASGTFRMTYDGLSERAVPGDLQIYKLLTRFLVNDPADQITGEVEIRDGNGNSAVWEMDVGGVGFETHDLPLQDAVGGGELTGSLALEYRFIISGDLADNTGVAIDHASTFPFALKSRPTDLGTGSVQDTGRNITRRFDGSVLAMMQDLGTEDGYQSFVDDEDIVHYEPSGSEEDELQIIRGETPVVKADFDRDYDRIVNEVIVQGDGVQEIVRDPESIRFYGTSARDEPIVDQKIKTSEEAKARGDGYLRDNAWNDTIVTFEIADTQYQRLQKGSSVFVDWPNENLLGFFVTRHKDTNESGVVTVELGVRT